jgi:hypothetical protein
MEQNDEGSELIERYGGRRVSIQRVSFAMPQDGMSTRDFSLITALCLSGGGDEGRIGTGVPGPDCEIEVHIKTPLRESE